MNETYVSITQAVKILKKRGIMVNRCHFARKCNNGDLPGAYKLGGVGSWVVPISSLMAYKPLRIRK